MPPSRNALLSVSDTTGLADIAAHLARHHYHLIASGGTARFLRDHGFDVKNVADITGFPEILDGRVKTLHPHIHGGILARRDHHDHDAARQQHQIPAIDIVIVNLYPFRQTSASGADLDSCLEQIDIGGVALIRAAGKNHRWVTIAVDPDDYPNIIAALDKHRGQTDTALRQSLAVKAFAVTAAYDAAIAARLARDITPPPECPYLISAHPCGSLRYGENPHQNATLLCRDDQRGGVMAAQQHSGKAIGYNTLLDLDAALACVDDAPDSRPAVAIVKHNNPCGIAYRDTLAEAWIAAWNSDRKSAFGGVAACNQPIDAPTAMRIADIFIEAILAPAITPEALAILSRKPQLRVLTMDTTTPRGGSTLRSLRGGGLLVQDEDDGPFDRSQCQIVTDIQPSSEQWRDLSFAFQMARRLLSNAVVYAANEASCGIGCGQPNRVDAVDLATRRLHDHLSLAADFDSDALVLASDGFFPFADGIEAAIAAGARAIIQPGGSVRDDDLIAAANRAGIAMVFTGRRCFRH